jgi:hypothetical protein
LFPADAAQNVAGVQAARFAPSATAKTGKGKSLLPAATANLFPDSLQEIQI